jgi:hypothetical protein
MTSQSACEELDRLNREVVSAILEARAIRLSRDVSFQEDGALSRAANEKAEAVISHLLAGHGGKPCPAGGRPIVTAERRPIEGGGPPPRIHTPLD